eukprot:scaffold24806_cov129-Isochrysis_galbana.AAC.3
MDEFPRGRRTACCVRQVAKVTNFWSWMMSSSMPSGSNSKLDGLLTDTSSSTSRGRSAAQSGTPCMAGSRAASPPASSRLPLDCGAGGGRRSSAGCRGQPCSGSPSVSVKRLKMTLSPFAPCTVTL